MIDRAKLERDARRKLGKLSDKHLRELERLLGDPPDPTNVPGEWWDRVDREHRQALASILVLGFMAAVDDLDDFGAGGIDPNGWADKQSAWTADRYVSTSQNKLNRLADNWQAESPLPGEIRGALSSVFGPARTSSVAGTEITRALSRGVLDTVRGSDAYADGNIALYWRLGMVEHHCPRCLAVADTDTWDTEYPDGPPIHPRCDCRIEVVRLDSPRAFREFDEAAR